MDLPAPPPEDVWTLPPLPDSLRAELEVWIVVEDGHQRALRRAAVADWLMRDRGL